MNDPDATVVTAFLLALGIKRRHKLLHERVLAFKHVHHEAALDDCGEAGVDLGHVETLVWSFTEVNVGLLGWDLFFLVKQLIAPLCELLLVLIHVTLEVVLVDLGHVAETIDNLTSILSFLELLDYSLENRLSPDYAELTLKLIDFIVILLFNFFFYYGIRFQIHIPLYINICKNL